MQRTKTAAVASIHIAKMCRLDYNEKDKSNTISIELAVAVIKNR